MRGWHIMRGDGDGTTLYFGRHRGARFIGIGLRGFSGWSSSRWLPGGWEFFSPHIHIGRLFMDRGWWRSCRVLIPAKLVHLWRWRRRSYRDAMREEPMPQERR
jgi:hypothetical protein